MSPTTVAPNVDPAVVAILLPSWISLVVTCGPAFVKAEKLSSQMHFFLEMIPEAKWWNRRRNPVRYFLHYGGDPAIAAGWLGANSRGLLLIVATVFGMFASVNSSAPISYACWYLRGLFYGR